MSTSTNTRDSGFFTSGNTPANRPQYPAGRFPQFELEIVTDSGEYIPYEEVSSVSQWEKAAMSPAVDESIPATWLTIKKAVPVVTGVTLMAGIGYVIYTYWTVILIGIAGSFAITAAIYNVMNGRRRSGTYDTPTPPSSMPSAGSGVNVFVNQTGQGNQSNININL